MNIDIKNITTISRRTNYIQLNVGKSTKVIDQDYFKKTDIFPDDFIKNVRIMQINHTLLGISWEYIIALSISHG